MINQREMIQNFLQTVLTPENWLSLKNQLHFTEETFKEKFESFELLRQSILDSISSKNTNTSSMSKMTDKESECYRNSGNTVYYSERALLAVFTDCTERSPTFSLKPLDTIVEEERNMRACWIKVRRTLRFFSCPTDIKLMKIQSHSKLISSQLRMKLLFIK